MSPIDSTREVIVTLLRNFGSRREIEQYLKEFSSLGSSKFAVIKVGGGILADQLDELASDLVFLRQVGLFPIVLHGAGPQLNQALEEAGISTERIDGLRVTSPEVLEIARRVFQRVNLRLVEALEERGTSARPITTGVFEAEPVDPHRLGLVGNVRRVHLEPIESAIRSGHLPVLACLGESAGGQILNVNADVAARELALAIQPYKIIFISTTEGLLDSEGHLISAVNLAEDYEDLMSQPWVHSGMRLKLQEIKQILDPLPDSSSVSITSPAHLARELFTHRGFGTLIRRGERVHRYESFDQIDLVRLRQLVESSFQRPLVEDYFDSKTAHRIYLAESYRAAAIVTLEGNVPFLDKFAVTQQAQGAGIGSSLWHRMRDENPKLFWRARHDNPINPWYFERSDGTFRDERWIVFWYGLEGFDQVKESIQRALSLPPTLQVGGLSVESDGL
jgi:acetylglutamate kinase